MYKRQDEDDAAAAPIGAHAAEQPTAPEATPAPAHFAEPVAAAINESAAVFAAPEPAAPAFPIAPASEVAPASTPAPEAGPSPEDGPAPRTPQPAPASEPIVAAEPAAQPQSTPAPSHFATPEPMILEPQDDQPAVHTSEELDSPDDNDAAPSAEADTVSPGDTAEIDVAAVEAKLKDPGSTMSFEPLAEERIETDPTYDAGTTTQLMWGARSDVGCVRPHNEDSYLVQSLSLIHILRHAPASWTARSCHRQKRQL